MAIYHICRICVRPRSARYHRDHPIPVDGLPPPPGICRRCRIASVSGSKTIADVVEVHESGEVKLGVKCLVPEKDYTSAEAMQARLTQRFIDEEEYVELESVSASARAGDIIYRRRRASASWDADAGVAYRHVQMTVPPPPPPPSRTAPRTGAVTSGKQARAAVASTAAAKGSTLPFSLESPELTRPMPLRAASPTDPKRTEVTETPGRSRSRRRHSTSIVIEAYKQERSESEIRRLARDEVERYRQAERLMEAHNKAYAHGKLVAVEHNSREPDRVVRVPVERRIALVEDIVDRPWDQSRESSRQLEYATVTRREQSQARRTRLEDAYASHRERLEATSTSDRRQVEVDFSSQTKRYNDMVDRNITIHGAQGELKESTPPPRHQHSQIPREHPRTHKSVDTAARGVVTVEERRIEPDETEILGEAALRSVNSPPPSSSSISSDKTRWPATLASRREKASGQTSKQAVVEVGVERYEDAPAKSIGKPTRPQQEVRLVYARQSDDWNDEEYWLDGIPTQRMTGRASRATAMPSDEPVSTSKTPRVDSQRQRVATETMLREPEPASGTSAVHTTYRAAERKAPPYPADESIVSAQMPSPKAHTPTSKTIHHKDADDDYIYVERRVTESSSRPGHEKPYYEKQEIFGQRRSVPQSQSKPEEAAQREMRPKDSKMRTSDVSSRVHFAKHVEVSPTPPGSDASSTRFRNLGRARTSGGGRTEKGEDLIAEYERRGRARSRLPYEGYDYR